MLRRAVFKVKLPSCRNAGEYSNIKKNWTHKIFCNYPKILTMWFNHMAVHPKYVHGMANIVGPNPKLLLNPDQTLRVCLCRPVYQTFRTSNLIKNRNVGVVLI